MKTDFEFRPSTEKILHELATPDFQALNQQANDETIKRMKQAVPILIGIGKAGDNIPGMRKNLILHAGPPITWQRASGALKGAIIGGLIYEGLAKNKGEAEEIMKEGSVDLEPCHNHSAAGPMAGIITYSMSVYIVEDRLSGYRAYSNLSDDRGDNLGSSMRFGVYDKAAIDQLHWNESHIAPVLDQVIKEKGGIDFLPIIGRSLLMGDDCHVMTNAATLLLSGILLPGIIKNCKNKHDIEKIATQIHQDGTFSLNPIMATCKAIADAGNGIPHSSIITTMARNGTEFGIKVSGLGDTWFTGIAGVGHGSLTQGLTPADVNRDMGDSAITETVGFGGIVRSFSGSNLDTINNTMSMYNIAHSESDSFLTPGIDDRGPPLGFDLLKIIKLDTTPIINSSLANKTMNRYMAGVGALHPPMEAFTKAAARLLKEEEEQTKLH
ncbi:DUF1116 domain-containing protein [Microbulbifer sp. OS29]|uniref:DUF1116 domain-containing protein n=1 Tax=Microbulbifer okhotskensis TaxID=2926617 RepID=A0A9X2ELI3_9GAMM|nr:DUF1116 domain-containing protein [Microbulbifer okhotskensis]MCO1334444.1 DUF1116 domain-containing protein [Microbulbifer okhotskensis]